jgi:hypothetical protein
MKLEVGQIVGHWRILNLQVGKLGKKTRVFCTACNLVEREIYSDQLRIGRSTSCGCKRQEKNRITKDTNNQLLKAGDRFGFWEVLEKRGSSSLVRCTGCSREVQRKNCTLLDGSSKSCGCKRLELDLTQKPKHYARNKKDVKIGQVIQGWKVIGFKNHLLECICLKCKENTRIVSLNEIQGKRRKSCGCFNRLTPEQMSKKSTYYHRVQYLTSLYSTHLSRIGDQHVDHIFSVAEGFRRQIEPEIISHPGNLQILDAQINRSKNSDCWISEEELYSRYRDFKSTKVGG